MKECDSCSRPLADGHPFMLCTECLFGAALNSHEKAPTGTTKGDFPVSIRRNFFDKYEILKKMGVGGQGEVWEVWDFEFRRRVAMKRISESAVGHAPAIYRFLAEAQVTSQLDHPGILPVFDVGADPDGRLYYTTQLLSGETLATVLEQIRTRANSAWNLNRVLELLLRVCDVMGHAHSRGVVHRDLKPANVMVGAFGDVRVVDWGSAHILKEARKNFEESFVPLTLPEIETDRSQALKIDPDSPLATASSGHPVTLLFTPPEIVAGNLSELAPATDIYALGVILYQILTGRTPFLLTNQNVVNQADLKQAILLGRRPSVMDLNRKASRDLASITEKAMAFDPRERYRTMADLADDLRAAMELRPVQARSPGVFLKLQRWSQRNFSYVVIAGGVLLLSSIAFSLMHGLKAQRDAARQSTFVRDAELAARSGHWREALRDWDAAEAAGYNDTIYLNLKRAEAWTVLAEPDLANALLTHLASRSDLGSQRGIVLLHLGEHDLFDGNKSVEGVRLVREAMSAGLTNADLLFAKGLLADSTPEALDLFHQALQYNPYYHGAHRHGLSLEFLLGRHEELADHLAIFKILYPQDPSPEFIVAAEEAMAGNLANAEKALALVQGQVNTNVLEQADLACRAYAAAAKFYDLDTLLKERDAARTPLDTLRTNPFSAGAMLIPGDFVGLTNREALRIPRLPCVREGFMAAGDGLRELLQPYLANSAMAVRNIELGWRHHPEALIPALAGMLLENQQPEHGPRSIGILQAQSHLYQMSAESDSMMPQIGRLARYLATRSEYDLVMIGATNSSIEISNCLMNIRAVVASPETSALECDAYFKIALKLGANDLALQLVDILEKQQPNELTTRQSRIEVESALGAIGPALNKINQILLDNPNDHWAVSQRKVILKQLKMLINATNDPPKLNH